MADDLNVRYHLSIVNEYPPTLPEPEETTKLMFKVLDMSDGASAPGVGVSVAFTLHFLDKLTFQEGKTPAVALLETGSWAQGVVTESDRNGLATAYLKQGALNVDVNLEVNIPPFTDTLRDQKFHLKSKTVVPKVDVKKLVLVSGDRQFTTLDGEPFHILEVQALGEKNVPLEKANIQFQVQGSTGSQTATAEPTKSDGKTHVLLTKGTVPGVFTVTANSGSAEPVVFHLALGPNYTDLEIWVSSPISISSHFMVVDCPAKIRTKGQADGWPYAHGQVSLISPEIRLVPNSLPPDRELISGDKGELLVINTTHAPQFTAVAKSGSARAQFIMMAGGKPLLGTATFKIT
ncbi:hypothetical protein [Chromobacterium sp. ATCC 53434]|uniref:hypothetical protein n=1 Tax=Chromobacterium sp. (strain ATCC 53434 / SC 14030) TaxID=2059672 RepID=UPI0013053A83|nr:hypothetical protein [Chromobacterium sp. ATCC 53434]